MTGVAITIMPENIGQVERVLNTMARRGADMHKLLDAVGALAETQTRRRLATEKTDPAGQKWEQWSWDYAASKHGRHPESHAPHPGRLRSSGSHSILLLEGDMLDSVTHVVEFGEVSIGVVPPYGPAHQFGIGVPKREFLGFSAGNIDEVDKELNAWAKAVSLGYAR